MERALRGIAGAFIISSVMLALISLSVLTASAGNDIDKNGSYLYLNALRMYQLRIPAQLKVNFTRENDREWAVENLMPFDYVNFGPKLAGEDYPDFELGIGVHLNKHKLSTREFADKKDIGLKMNGATIEIIRQSNTSISRIEGVRDDFRVKQPSGWKSYTRIIIFVKENFFVLLATLGQDKPIPEYELLFEEIAESFKLL